MVFYIEPLRLGLDRRVFRRTASGALEWAHYSDWSRDAKRARYYGSFLKDVPDGSEEFYDEGEIQ